MADALQGTWVFNDIVNLKDADYFVNFSSNGINFTELYIELTALETLWGGIIYKSDSANREAYGLINKQVQWADKAYKTITITSKLSEVTGGETLLTWLQANATKQSSISFKHFFRNSPIGSGTIRFRPYTVAEPLPQLATVSNVSVEGTTVSWDEVENATSYEVLADGESIGTAYNSTFVFFSYDWSSDYYVQYSIDGGNTFTSISVPTSEESTMEFDLGLISTIIFKVKCYGGFSISTQDGYGIISTIDDTEKTTEEFTLSNRTVFRIARMYD